MEKTKVKHFKKTLENIFLKIDNQDYLKEENFNEFTLLLSNFIKEKDDNLEIIDKSIRKYIINLPNKSLLLSDRSDLNKKKNSIYITPQSLNYNLNIILNYYKTNL